MVMYLCKCGIAIKYKSKFFNHKKVCNQPYSIIKVPGISLSGPAQKELIQKMINGGYKFECRGQ